MKIIETSEDFNSFLNRFYNDKSVVIPIMTDSSAHPAVNSVCVLFVRFLKGDEYVLPFKHTEAQNLPENNLELISPLNETVYASSKKVLMHLSFLGQHTLDLKGIEYLATGAVMEEEKFYTPYMRYFYGRFSGKKDLNAIIPLMQLVQYAEDYSSYLIKYIKPKNSSSADFLFHNNIVIPACHFMETSGVHVNSDLFIKFYGEKVKSHIVDGLVYTEYNPYTTTGRVTNKYGGVNYAAIEKTNGTRTAFTSRFNTGSLVLIDFESFHLRLISELINYNLPNQPVHEYLASQYFNTDEVTPEQYEEGKKITFKYLYSDRQEGNAIPFFARVYDFIDETWNNVQSTGFYQSKSGRRVLLDHMEMPSPSKLFNYILQLRETEVAMSAIYQLQKLFKGYQSKVVLYTYDSILIDYSYDDGKELLLKTKDVLSMNGNYPVRLYAGKNYQEMVNVGKFFK